MAENTRDRRHHGRMREFVRIQYGRGSYMPVLMAVIEYTRGPILELGCGYVSTPYLHWSCYRSGREVVSYENDPSWFGFASKFNRRHHSVNLVEDWDKIDLERPWEVAFVDHSPNDRRWQDILRLGHVDYVIVHDTNNRDESKYHHSRALNRFRHRYKYTKADPYTSVVSNKYDLRWLEGL